MPIENFIITVYCLIEELYQDITKGKSLRHRGPIPALSDVEVLTMLVVGEHLGLEDDKTIWACYSRHWKSWFSMIGCRTSFTRQSANLLGIYDQMQEDLSHRLCDSTDLYLFDGFPIPVCHVKRYKRSSPFRGLGAVSYCAAKDAKYFGFKGHLLITSQGAIKAFSMVPANVDERDLLPEVTKGVTGDVIADKGLIRPELSKELKDRGLQLHTPLRSNMKDPRPKAFVSQIMNLRRKVETVIGQFVERFRIQAIRATDLWHLMAKIKRKLLSHSISLFLNRSLHPENPLQIENLLA